MRTEKGELKQGKYYKRVSGEERSEVQTKKRLLHIAEASDLSGNRTRVYAVRGRRLDRLTNRP